MSWYYGSSMTTTRKYTHIITNKNTSIYNQLMII